MIYNCRFECESVEFIFARADDFADFVDLSEVLHGFEVFHKDQFFETVQEGNCNTFTRNTWDETEEGGVGGIREIWKGARN